MLVALLAAQPVSTLLFESFTNRIDLLKGPQPKVKKVMTKKVREAPLKKSCTICDKAILYKCIFCV